MDLLVERDCALHELNELLIASAPFLDEWMTPLLILTVHKAIPLGVVVGNHIALDKVTSRNGNVLDLSTDTISHGIPHGPEFFRIGKVFRHVLHGWFVVARVIGKDMRRSRHVNGLAPVSHATVKAVALECLNHLVKASVVILAKVA